MDHFGRKRLYAQSFPSLRNGDFDHIMPTVLVCPNHHHRAFLALEVTSALCISVANAQYPAIWAMHLYNRLRAKCFLCHLVSSPLLWSAMLYYSIPISNLSESMLITSGIGIVFPFVITSVCSYLSIFLRLPVTVSYDPPAFLGSGTK